MVILSTIFSIIIVLILLLLQYITPNNNYIGGKEYNNIQNSVYKLYHNLKIPKKRISFNDFCFPKHFKLQKPQQFIANYMGPQTNNMNMLGFHKIGAGKTCSIIQACEQWTGIGKPLVIMPASLITGFLNEIRGPCGNNKYISLFDMKQLQNLHPKNLKYKEIIAISNKLIYSKYDIMSYNKFITSYRNLNPPFMAIDEVHNILNPNGVYNKIITKFINLHPEMKLLVMSATPIFDNPNELVYLLQLMRQNVTLNILNNKTQLRDAINGLVSYYSGAPTNIFPQIYISYKICKMSQFQTRWYHSELEGEFSKDSKVKLYDVSNNFYSRSRARSNIVFPHGLAPTYGVLKLKKYDILNNLHTYSTKFWNLLKQLKKGQLSFVYTNFSNFGGIKMLIKCLHVFGYIDYRNNKKGPKYAVFSGNETAAEKDAIRKIYNSTENDNGSLIQVIIGSPATKEGISLLRTRQVHIIDPYWNYSRLDQIIGRAVRTCSHKTLPVLERNVTVYFYIAVSFNSNITKSNIITRKEISPYESIDGYILKLAEKKRDINADIIKCLIENAVDAKLNQ